jgi:signal transduction histidine kinase
MERSVVGSPSAKRSSDLAALLRRHKEDLLRRWTRRVLSDPRVPEASRLSEPELRDHIPRLIDRIVGCLEAADQGQAAGQANDVDSDGKDHAHHRLAEDYSLTEALSELSHFRAAILDLCAVHGVTLEVDAARTLHAAIDQAMISGSDVMEHAAREKSRERAAFRERFMGILGHDLRSPLQAINLATAIVLKHHDTTDAIALLARRIAGSADRMGRMIADLLDLTRARQGGGIPIELKQADLGAIVQQAIDEVAVAHPDRTIDLDAQGEASGAWDPDRMAQVMANLVSNALDYSPVGTPVRVVLRAEAGYVSVAVNNRGSTIAPEVMARLFEPFVQGAQEGRVAQGQGLGLGLFIVRQIVEAHGGSIGVASTKEEGTTFTVRLPHGP